MTHIPPGALARIESSNLPTREKSAIRRWYEGTLEKGGRAAHRARGTMAASGQVLRQGAESVAVGAALGAAHVYLKNGLDMGKVPVDAVIGVAGMAAGVWLTHDGYGEDLRNAGASALSIFAFRKTYEMAAEKREKSGKPVGGTFRKGAATHAGEGDMGEDPIVRLAKHL